MISEQPSVIPGSYFARVAYFFVLIVVPIFSFLMGDGLKPDWQSGDNSDYAGLLLSHDTTPFFYPFLIFSTVCYLLLLIPPSRFFNKDFTQNMFIRFGVFSSNVLYVHYTVLVFIASDGEMLEKRKVLFLYILMVCLPLIVESVSRILRKKYSSKIVGIFWVAACVVIWIGAAAFRFMMGYSEIISAPPAMFMFAILFVGPMWCLIISIKITSRLMKVPAPCISHKIITGWITGYVFSWVLSIEKAVDVYYSLPVKPPDCYIATAAANGHKNFVSSFEGAESLRINRQLQLYKFFEVALMTIFPQLHKMFRKIYDVMGLMLSRYIMSPWLADIAYVFLKPGEIFIEFIVRLFFYKWKEKIYKFYSIKMI